MTEAPEPAHVLWERWYADVPKDVGAYCRCLKCCCPPGTGHDTDAYRA